MVISAWRNIKKGTLDRNGIRLTILNREVKEGLTEKLTLGTV